MELHFQKPAYALKIGIRSMNLLIYAQFHPHLKPQISLFNLIQPYIT